MKTTGIAAVSAAALTALAGAASAQFQPNSLIVSRVGDGSAALAANATAVFLDAFDKVTAGQTAYGTVALPTTVSGPNFRLTLSGTATSEGGLSLSSNGRFLTIGGYDAATGTASISNSSSTINRRVAAIIDITGPTAVVNTSTGFTDTGTAAIRSVASTDGTNVWFATSNSNLRYGTSGGSTSTNLSTSPSNTRRAGFFGGQLYGSAASSTFQGVFSVGTGLPTTSGQTSTALPGFPTATGPQPYDFFFASSSTLYVADDRTSGGGIQKWTLSSGTWSLAYTIGTGAANIGARGLAGELDGLGNVTLYAVTAEASNNRLIRVSDALSATTNPNNTITTLATSGTNTLFRGVALPTPGSAALFGLAGLIGLRRRR
ncbi:MAG: hypothetical protein IBJ11_07180 [Phycisphaerales bacterium]|nr:hypothetical protein [Phycisphaerales bacterium]